MLFTARHILHSQISHAAISDRSSGPLGGQACASADDCCGGWLMLVGFRTLNSSGTLYAVSMGQCQKKSQKNMPKCGIFISNTTLHHHTVTSFCKSCLATNHPLVQFNVDRQILADLRPKPKSITVPNFLHMVSKGYKKPHGVTFDIGCELDRACDYKDIQDKSKPEPMSLLWRI